MKKNTANTLSIILIVAFVLLSVYRMFLGNKGITGEIKIVNYLRYSFALAWLIVRITFHFFPNWYNDKPTREELDTKEQEKE